MQALSHAFAKAAMFLAAGLVAESLGHDRIAELGGAARAMPVTFLALGLGGLSLMGLPPSGGFAAKWLLMKASIEAGQWAWAVVMPAGGLLAGGYLYRVLAPALSGESPQLKKAPGVAAARAWRWSLALARHPARLRAAGVLRLPADRPTGRGACAAMNALAAQFGPALLVAALAAPLVVLPLPHAPRCAACASAITPLAAAPALAAAALAIGGAPFGAELPALRVSLWLDQPGGLLLLAAALVWLIVSIVAFREPPVAAIADRGDAVQRASGRTPVDRRATDRVSKIGQGRPNAARFAVSWLLTMAGSLGVFIAADLLTFYLVYALVSLPAYYLVAHDEDAELAPRRRRLYGVCAARRGGPADRLRDAGGRRAAAAASRSATSWRRCRLRPGATRRSRLIIIGFGMKIALVPAARLDAARLYARRPFPPRRC